MNYQKELDKIIGSLGSERPRLLLHACCAPCSSYCLKYLAEYFDITDYYYNPNISSQSEYDKRVKEQIRLIDEYNDRYLSEPSYSKISFVEGEYEPERFYEISKGLENEPERGKRCYKCYELRMRKTAEYAQKHGYEYFTTTLSISPLKDADWINEIGVRLEIEYGVKHLTSDFKKKGGYLESIKLSKEYDLYRQDYCGCGFSKRDREKEERKNETVT